MTNTYIIVSHFPSHEEAEKIVLERQKGFDMQKLSSISKDYANDKF